MQIHQETNWLRWNNESVESISPAGASLQSCKAADLTKPACPPDFSDSRPQESPLSSGMRRKTGSKSKPVRTSWKKISFLHPSVRPRHSWCTYPGTPSTFIDTWAEVEEGDRLHVTSKNKNNDDSAEFSGVGGDSGCTPPALPYRPPATTRPQMPFLMNAGVYRTHLFILVKPVYLVTWTALLFCRVDRISVNLNEPMRSTAGTSPFQTQTKASGTAKSMRRSHFFQNLYFKSWIKKMTTLLTNIWSRQ